MRGEVEPAKSRRIFGEMGKHIITIKNKYYKQRGAMGTQDELLCV